MNIEFATAMRRASEQTRAQNLVEATRLIQQALNGRPGAAEAGTDGTAPRLDSPSSTLRDEAADASAGASRPPRVRRPLGETLRTLKEGRLNLDAFAGLPGAVSGGLQGRAAPPPPEGARFEARRFDCAAGGRSFKLYVPSSAPERPRGLLVMLHGCTQNPDDFALGTGMNAIAETHGFAVAYPAQTSSHNASSCWNWFSPENQRRDAGEPAIIAGLTRKLVAEFGIDPARVFVAGLSAGGAMAAVMGETYPDLYAGVGVHSGLPTHAAHDMPSAFATMRGHGSVPRKRSDAPRAMRTIVFHGTADRTVHLSNAERIVEDATPDAASISARSVAGQAGRRGYTRTVVANPEGEAMIEQWLIDGAGHAWSGGRPGGSYVDPTGPDASAEMMRFFIA
ncbi:PHB depolymerase family esterase [Chelatococcus sambhunathii]|uniref:PHB depolymerase family esterase n=1 Tax=Chelatococcus sambhunathii TaxID=363953 RepID=A0ABU1DKZ6_9HYPH|nr:PHB depolymerase family esterase [Chelatococcus sambhunathii]MDR4308644.1 PHB depolymerase family esterase [Chelatococcus sambhunathii]